MNMIPFREHHLFALLNAYTTAELPLDLAVHHYFREHKALGSKDRAFLAETIYKLVRWQVLLDYLTNSSDWKTRFQTLQQLDITAIQNDPAIALNIKASCPQELFELLTETWGEQKAYELCLISNEPAPTFIRTNTLKITRDALIEKWLPNYAISPTEHSANGIIFHKKINFFQLPEFKDGFFEVQDEGSQLLANLVDAKPGDQVMDYCAGSGGKTLAFAPQMAGKGQIFVHDIRVSALQEARKRLKRAAIQNAQTIEPDSATLSKIKKRMDWVLVDAPCSGTGTLRRNPDMKSRVDHETITRLVGQQRTIFEKALSFLKPTGKIVYATCSILKQENEQQLEHFMKTYSLVLDGEPWQSLPSAGGMDGFFGVVLKRG